jgi:hypothetical protein
MSIFAKYVGGQGAGAGEGAGVTSLNGLTGILSIVAGSGISVTPAGSSITIASTGGTGNVTGPGTSVVNNIAVFNNTTGTLLADAPVSINSSSSMTFPADGTGDIGATGTTNLRPNRILGFSLASIGPSSLIGAGLNASLAAGFVLSGGNNAVATMLGSSSSAGQVGWQQGMYAFVKASNYATLTGWTSHADTTTAVYFSEMIRGTGVTDYHSFDVTGVSFSGTTALKGSTSGSFSMQASATTTSYTVTMPAAQGSGALTNNGSGVLSWSGTGTFANTSLSNLSAVAINTSLLPGVDNSINLGSQTLTFASLYLANGIYDDNNNGQLVIDVGDNLLYDNETNPGTISIDWANRLLLGTAGFGHVTVNWGAYLLSDSAAAASVDWNNRLLSSPGVSVELAWNATGASSQIGIQLPKLTASTALALDANNVIISSSTTTTELGYVHGVTSSIQTQINTLSTGISWRAPVEAYATANVPLTGSTPLVIDGYTVVNGNSVLLSNQTTTSQNGVYNVAISGGSYTLTLRETAAVGYAYLVLDGTTYSYDAFVVNAISPTTYHQFAGPTEYTFMAPLVQTGNVITITQAGTSSNGYLSSTDWNTFNNKQAAGSYITALTGDVTATGPGSATSHLVATSNATLTTLSALTTASSLASVGTITSGTWNATDIGATYGGTGINTSASTGVPVISAGTWSVDSTLPIALGGTNNGAAYTAGSVIFSNGTSLTQNNANFFWDNTNLALGIGTSPATTAVLDIVNNSGTAKAVQTTGYGANVGFRGRYANGTLASPTAATTGNTLSFFSGRGYGTSQFATASTGAINFVAGATFTNTSNPTYIQFQVTPSGSVTLAEAMRINSTGNVLIDTTTDNGTDVLQIGSGIFSSYLKVNGVGGTVTLTGPASGSTFATIGPLAYTNGTINYTLTPAELSNGSSGSALTLNLSNGAAQSVTLSANTTFTLSNAIAGGSYVIRIIQGSGSYTVTWAGSNVFWPGGFAPVITTTAGFVDLINFYFDGTNYYGSFNQNYAV